MEWDHRAVILTCFSSITTANNSVPNQTATILTDGDANTGGNQSLSKGRLNFGTSPYTTIQPHHIITLIDSQSALTQATYGYRPLASVNDVWIGTDVPSGGTGLNSGQLAFGAPVSITNYIAQTGDGIHANWLERLSAALKEFNVPAKFDQSVTLAGLSNGCLNVASGVIASTGSPCGSGGGGGVNSVFGRSGAVVAASGDYTVSQVTGAAADASVVHNTGTETIAGAKTFTANVTVEWESAFASGGRLRSGARGHRAGYYCRVAGGEYWRHDAAGCPYQLKYQRSRRAPPWLWQPFLHSAADRLRRALLQMGMRIALLRT